MRDEMVDFPKFGHNYILPSATWKIRTQAKNKTMFVLYICKTKKTKKNNRITTLKNAQQDHNIACALVKVIALQFYTVLDFQYVTIKIKPIGIDNWV